MTWIQLSADITEEAIDWIRTLLAEIHYSGKVHIASKSDLVVEKPTSASEWELEIQLYLPDDTHAQAIIQQIQQHLSSLQRTGMMSDWRLNLVEELSTATDSSPIHSIGRFVIVSPHVSVQLTPNQIPLTVEQTLAFGSGFHPATMLCLRSLERYVTPGMNTLDLGCGSGILSVAMAKLGASVTAIDNDAIAIQATQTTVQQNQVSDRVKTFVGSLGHGSTFGHWMGGELDQAVETVAPQADFDLIVANIFARIHLSLVEDYRNALKRMGDRGGLLITAGYDTDYEQEMDTALQQVGFQAIACERSENWLAFTHQLQTESDT